MSTDSTSIFDLSPSEKLQLVEDLWDDLASVPTNVPIQGWQLEEVERRADNLRANPAATVSWEELKRNIRIHNGR